LNIHTALKLFQTMKITRAVISRFLPPRQTQQILWCTHNTLHTHMKSTHSVYLH